MSGINICRRGAGSWSGQLQPQLTPTVGEIQRMVLPSYLEFKGDAWPCVPPRPSFTTCMPCSLEQGGSAAKTIPEGLTAEGSLRTPTVARATIFLWLLWREISVLHHQFTRRLLATNKNIPLSYAGHCCLTYFIINLLLHSNHRLIDLNIMNIYRELWLEKYAVTCSSN